MHPDPERAVPRACLFCDVPLGEGVPSVPSPRHRHAYDPHLGRLWEVCPACARWNPVPLALRWEVIEAWESLVGAEGRIVLRTEELTLLRVRGGEVVRVGRPPLAEWGAWRYGDRIPPRSAPPSFLSRLLGSLPPPPLGGYDPYGLSGPMGGVGGRDGPREWLASPFLAKAQPLTLGFATFPFAPECPSCGLPMPLNPWRFQDVTFELTSRRPAVQAECASCGDSVLLELGLARPAIRLGLAILDSEPEARTVGERAGENLERVGGGRVFLEGLGRLRVPLGELERPERVALGIALDRAAEGEALDAEWREAEEITKIMDGELTDVPGFREFRARVLGRPEG